MLRPNAYIDNEIMDALNELLQVDRINVVEDKKSGKFMYSYIDSKRKKELNKMDFEEIEIFKLMEQAGNMGLTSKEL